MHWPNLRAWIGQGGSNEAPAPAPSQGQVPDDQAVCLPSASPGSAAWPRRRLAVTDALWGEGFQLPGGEMEVLRLARPLGLSAASSLLLVGAGSGGPPCSVASRLGVWVTGFETEAGLVQLGNERAIRTGLGRRAQMERWDPGHPELGHGYFHHALALEPLRGGNHEPVLAAIATALKPAGQVTLLETVAEAPLDPREAAVASWARLDHRNPALLPSQAAVTRMLGRLGFEVRVAEDVSQRHMQQALLGWRQVVGGLEQMKPTARQAGPLVAEAELWLLQLRLFRAQKLRRVRWLAIGHGG